MLYSLCALYSFTFLSYSHSLFLVSLSFSFVLYIYFTEPRKDKTDAQHGGNGTLSTPNIEQPTCQGSMLPPPGGGGGVGGMHQQQQQQHNQADSNNKQERPNTLGGSNKLSRRGVNICYHNEHCKYSVVKHTNARVLKMVESQARQRNR